MKNVKMVSSLGMSEEQVSNYVKQVDIIPEVHYQTLLLRLALASHKEYISNPLMIDDKPNIYMHKDEIVYILDDEEIVGHLYAGIGKNGANHRVFLIYEMSLDKSIDSQTIKTAYSREYTIKRLLDTNVVIDIPLEKKIQKTR